MKNFLNGVRQNLKKDTVIKLAALFFAVVLWNYVLSDTNPLRNKTVSNLTVKVLNQENLATNQLIVKEGLADIIGSTNVTISVQKNYLDNVTEDNVQVEADLSEIKEAGTYDIKLKVRTAFGSVVGVSPSSLKIVVDSLIKRTLPVECVFTGTAKDDVYVSDPVLTKKEIIITGPASTVNAIKKVVCYINLDTLEPLEKTQSSSLPVYFIGEDDVTLEDSVVQRLIKADTLSTTASYEVKNKKSVTVDISSSVLNADKLKKGYELLNATADPQTVSIAGTASALAQISSLKIEPVSLTGIGANTTKKSTLILPKDITLVGSNSINLNIVLQETKNSKTISGKQITVANLASGLTATLDVKIANVTISGNYSEIQKLSSSNVKLYVDVSGLSKGTYTASVKAELPSDSLTDSIQIAPQTVNITIK